MFLWRKFWVFVWDISEFFEISLGKAAPWVFEQMIGSKGKLIRKGNDDGRK